MTSSANTIFQIGEVINSTYQVEAVLGRGGTSEVYKVRSRTSGRVMAVKVLRAEFTGDEGYKALLTREEQIRDLRHPAIVQYFDTQQTQDGHVYLVMDYIEGPDLEERMKAGPIPADELLVIAERIGSGLDVAHSSNIIHRDLSPDNIILRGGVPSDAVIIDFGIAKDTNPDAETIIGGEFAGKYTYAAPEQLSGHVDARSDLYSLGALLLAAFRGGSQGAGRTLMEIVEAKKVPLVIDNVPEPLAGLIASLTHPDPDQRFSSAGEMLAALNVPAGGDGERTVFAPNAAATSSTPPAAVPAPDTEPATKASQTPSSPSRSTAKSAGDEKKARSKAPVLVLGALVLGGGAAAFMLGLIPGIGGPSLPLVDPYTLTVVKSAGQPVEISGYVPDTETQTALATRFPEADVTLTLARGEITEAWSADVLRLLSGASSLEEWAVAASGNQVTLTGIAETTDELDAVQDLLALNDGNWVLDVIEDLTLLPQTLPISEIEAAMAPYTDCGRVSLIAPPSEGYGPGQTINAVGVFAAEISRDLLLGTLQVLAGDRQVRLTSEVLNAAICKVESALPRRGPGGFSIEFSNGETGEINQTGAFKVGENPIIDLMVPASKTEGYVFVSIIDVTGHIFHLLPNNFVSANRVRDIRGGVSGDVSLRLAHSTTSGASGEKLAFKVDGSTELGTSVILVIHGTEDVFDGPRPMSESLDSYLGALQEASAKIDTIDRFRLTTSR